MAITNHPFENVLNARATSSAANTIVIAIPAMLYSYRINGLSAELEPPVTAGDFTLQIAKTGTADGTFADILSTAQNLKYNATYTSRSRVRLKGASFRSVLTSTDANLISAGSQVKLYVKAQTVAIADGGYSVSLFIS